MGEIHEALRHANRTPGTPEPRERQRDPEIVETFRAMAPAPAPVEPAEVVPVPPEKRGRWQAREVVVDARGPASESLRHLALRVRRELDARGARSIAVLSALREEGKTTLACNLALALAAIDSGRGVALVDLDLRKPRVADSLELHARVGIEDVLAGRAALRQACVSIDVPALDVYPALEPVVDAHRKLSQPALRSAIRELEREYAIVVVDTPPVLLVPDASLLLETVAAAIAVGRVGRSTRSALEAMCKMIPTGRLIGSVLNEGTLPARAHQYGYYGTDDGEEP